MRNHFGLELRFTYDAQDRIAELLPPGAVLGSGAGSPTSPIRYAHNEAASLCAGVRYGTYAYDRPGRVTRAEHAGGADRIDSRSA